VRSDSTIQAARRLDISAHTVTDHLKSIFEKRVRAPAASSPAPCSSANISLASSSASVSVTTRRSSTRRDRAVSLLSCYWFEDDMRIKHVMMSRIEG
jgi:hypothetical protein